MMFKLTARTLIALCVCLIVFLSCNKSAPEGKLVQGMVALTFDDASVDNWYTYLPLLDSLNIKATFYISHYHTLSVEQKTKLKTIQARGHQIAYHTSTHADLAKEVTKRGLADVEEKEIDADLKKMQADGYAPTDFAYPFGSCTKQLNTCLLRRFKSVRALCNQQNYNKSLVRESGEGKVYYGANVDNNSRLKDDGIITLMDKAQLHNDCLVLVAHQINNKNYNLQISLDRLRLLSTQAKAHHLEFITISKIAN